MSVTYGALSLPLSCVEVGSFDSAMKEIEYPGVDYVQQLDMGRRKRRITVTGRLPDATGGTTKASDIEDLDTSTVATLAHGTRTFPNCRVTSARTHNWVKVTGADGIKQSCEYTLELEQLQP